MRARRALHRRRTSRGSLQSRTLRGPTRQPLPRRRRLRSGCWMRLKGVGLTRRHPVEVSRQPQHPPRRAPVRKAVRPAPRLSERDPESSPRPPRRTCSRETPRPWRMQCHLRARCAPRTRTVRRRRGVESRRPGGSSRQNPPPRRGSRCAKHRAGRVVGPRLNRRMPSQPRTCATVRPRRHQASARARRVRRPRGRARLPRRERPRSKKFLRPGSRFFDPRPRRRSSVA